MNCMFTVEEGTLNILTSCKKELIDDELDYVMDFTYCPFCGQLIDFQHPRFDAKIEENES